MPLQHTATHCHILPRTATHCNTPSWYDHVCSAHPHPTAHPSPTYTMLLQHAATHCNTLQHAATRCNTPHHTTPHCNTPQHTLMVLSYLFCTSTPQRPSFTHIDHDTATRCNTLQHTATHRNTLQHTLMVLSYLFCTSAPHRPSLTRRCRGHCSSGPPLCPHPAHPEPSRAASGRSLPRGMSPSGPVAARRWYVEGGGRGRTTRRSSNRNESPKMLVCLSHVTLMV